MKYDVRFLKIVFWETLENIPLFLGFLLAIKFRSDSLLVAFICLVIGTTLGSGLIHFTEIKKYSNQPSLKETLTNFLVFTFMAVPFIFYFSTVDVWWSNWVTDLGLGIISGGGIALSESWGWNNAKVSTVRTHAISMAIAATLLFMGIRILHPLPLGIVLSAGLGLTLVVSIIISRIDYWPIKPAEPSAHHTS